MVDNVKGRSEGKKKRTNARMWLLEIGEKMRGNCIGSWLLMKNEERRTVN